MTREEMTVLATLRAEVREHLKYRGVEAVDELRILKSAKT